MSLSNPNKVVTEERLNEYHNTILPYLGGMPDILANKFNKSDLYSTDEKMIGRWIDGKPLYQKIVNFTVTSGGKTYAHNIQNVEHIHMVWGYLFTGNNETIPLTYSEIEGASVPVNMEYSVVVSSITNSNFYIYTGTRRNNKEVYMCLNYTKTTDSTVEIGLDTDYSTTEKIVGTWVDGKPIYQKTFTGNLSSMSSDTVTPTTIDVASLSVEDIIDIKGILTVVASSNVNKCSIGTARWLITSQYMPIEYMSSITCSITNGTLIINVYDKRFSNQPYNLTVQYTKTTD